MRHNFACPDCGLVIVLNSGQGGHDGTVKLKGVETAVSFNEKDGWDCPQCKCHYASEDFMEENCEKWDRSAKVNECKGCGYEISSDSTYCGECLCEEDSE